MLYTQGLLYLELLASGRLQSSWYELSCHFNTHVSSHLDQAFDMYSWKSLVVILSLQVNPTMAKLRTTVMCILRRISGLRLRGQVSSRKYEIHATRKTYLVRWIRKRRKAHNGQASEMGVTSG